MLDPPKQWKSFLLGGILAGVHTALFVIVTVAVATSSDPEAVMAYVLFQPLDYPASRLYQFMDGVSAIGLMPFLGGFLWFLYGFVFQTLFTIHRRHSLIRFGVGSLLLVLLCALPDIYLSSLPEWEQHWHRGTAALEAKHSDKAMREVSEAIQVSPRDNSVLDGMWDYLGRIYLEQKDYEQAEKAFRSALAAAEAKPNSRPMDRLNAYNELAMLYRRAGGNEHEKECLRKAIEMNRLVYQGDSEQEADCWYRLAEIAHDQGDSTGARALIERAIKLDSSLPQSDTWTLNHMREQLKSWTSK